MLLPQRLFQTFVPIPSMLLPRKVLPRPNMLLPMKLLKPTCGAALILVSYHEDREDTLEELHDEEERRESVTGEKGE